jgi:site-specific recombinase XerC
MTCITSRGGNRHTARHHRRESPALESARQNRYTNPLHTASADRRHGFASEVALTSKDPALVKELLGHASVRSTDVYMHARWDDMRRAVDAQQRTSGGVS